MFGRRWRTREELWYLAKYNAKGSWPAILFGVWTSFLLLGAILIKDSWEKDLPNWYATLIGLYFGVLISLLAYFRSQKSQDRMEDTIKTIEGFIMSKFSPMDKSIQNSKFFVKFALSGIIDTYSEFEKLAKQWKKKKTEDKKFLKNKILYLWENSMFEYTKILDDENIVSTNLYLPLEIEKLRMISNDCKRLPEFNETNNKINDFKFNRSVVNCIILLDKLKLDNKFRTVLTRY